MAREWFGRIPSEPDDRDWPAMPLTSVEPDRDWRYWWDLGWWGDQGATPKCVGYAWTHVLADGPKTGLHERWPDARDAAEVAEAIYCVGQRHDPWPGDCTDPQYDGTTVRAALKGLKEAGLIREYRWAGDVDEVVRLLLVHGPVVVGSRWPDGFMEPDGNGRIRYTDDGAYGHAYVVNGVNTGRGVVRVKNSWGRGWGDAGRAWLSIDDLDRLLAEPHAEAAVVIKAGR